MADPTDLDALVAGYLWQRTKSAEAERDAAQACVAVAEDALRRHGYRRSCDIPACNCGDQWAHGGHAERRLHEVQEALAQAEARVRALVTALEHVRYCAGSHTIAVGHDAPCGWGDVYRTADAALTPDDAALVARERAREAVVEAAPRVLSWLDEIVHLDRVPRACGACGTPNASCDMDCANAAYMSRDTRALRTALAALAAPERGHG